MISQLLIILVEEEQVTFIPDEDLFGKYRFINDYIEKMLWNYCFLNPGLTIVYNGKIYILRMVP